jgi:hypothetical protein
MPLALLLAFQAAAAPASPQPLLELDFDLAYYRPAELDLSGRGCDRSDPSAITVCARRAPAPIPSLRWRESSSRGGSSPRRGCRAG